MTDEAQRWKEKYLKSIEQQDKLERRWNARLDLLRRGLVRSSLAAEGADKAVDACMKEMREIVRKDDMDAGLAALIPRLEKAVLDSEQRREQRVEQMGTALTSLVAQLQALPLPKDVSKPLKRFAKSLEDRITQARELPLLLSELSGLQGQALSQIEHPDEGSRPGFLQRLFGGNREAVSEGEQPAEFPHSAPDPVGFKPQASDDGPQPSVAVSEAASENTELEAELRSAILTVPQPVAKEPERSIPEPHPEVAVEPVTPEPEPAAKTDEEPEASLHTADLPPPSAGEAPHEEAAEPVPEECSPEPQETVEAGVIADDIEIDAEDEAPDETATEDDSPYALPSSPEPSYSSVAAHIEETLLGLLDELTLPEHHRPQAEAMRARLEHGLNWYELLPILDDLAVLMLAITDSGQHEFEAYLKQLNERLESFQSGLLAASEDHADQQSASRQLDHQLREHVDDLQTSVQQAADLDSLKHLLESRLEGLIGTMDHHQKQRDEREQEVATRLQALSSRVATMEQEALGFRVHLEEQRQKALIDTLTGLPNRAAWNERLEHEINQLQRKRSSLLLGILDLDHFKRINDGYGHLAGDKVLKIIAGQLRKRLRASDFIARFGGEEFVILLPTTPMDEGLGLLERLREGIEQCPFHFKGERVTVTVSMGITLFAPGERSDAVLKRADQALYRAKREGRNRIEQG
ncbi:GGDEF domain-containing protein [Pseudomonas petrae]|uniref:GGDEF domain-containing protein n=1 Tax=Pseudomonas petrae TaxID=2912190 RepID=UPI001EF0D9B7|nr:GGDEF domain-containing protein [Pseudomonas petrae]MCF7531746.1 diguanylate cyclase [Pseudomonas petrae]MCF7537309.1 diguanylate cyclase [Pseudomonas petrae]MCF7556231.1 diguanylate cyclase [Pseudomonas petrae]